MVSLKKYKVGDEIRTKPGRWNSPFYVATIYKGYVVAINKKSIIWVYLFIKTYTGEVYYGSSRFAKYGLSTIKEIENFLDQVSRGEIRLDRDNCTTYSLILDEREYDTNEKRNQINIRN